MNERIKQFAKQAGWDGYEALDERHQKFAELIVRECIKESMEEIVSDDEISQEKDPLIREYLTGNNQGIVDAVVRFRNRFGVEE